MGEISMKFLHVNTNALWNRVVMRTKNMTTKDELNIDTSTT